MIITVSRYRRAADGAWDPLPDIRLYAPPPEAEELARQRTSGPCAPTHDEIIAGCEKAYGRVVLRGYSNPGDISVTVAIQC